MGAETFGWSLLAFLVCAALLWWLLRDVVVRSAVVASQILVLRLEPRRQPQRRPPWWLWLFLGGLALVGAGASMPYVETEPRAPERVVVVVETGLVAMAREGSETRLDVARRAILDRLGRSSAPEVRLALVTANAFPTVELFWSERDAFLERLSKLVATAAPTDWTASLDLARSLVGTEDATVWVAGSGLGPPLLAWREAQIDFPASLVPLPVGTSQINRGIDSLTASVRRDPRTREETSRIELAVCGVGPGVSERWMRQRSGLVVSSSEGRLAPRIAGPEYTVAADGSGALESYSLQLAGRFDELSVSLAVQDDPLDTDDHAILYLRPAPRVLVVEPRRERAAAVREKLSAAAYAASIDVVAELSEEADPAAHDLLLVNRRASPDPPWPPVHTLVYEDERDTGWVQFAEDVPSRLTRYVNVVSPFPLPGRAVEVDESMHPVLFFRSNDGTVEPLAAWGEREGRRQVSLGWDWTGATHDVHVALPTVWLHALDWLSPEEAQPGALWAGESFPVPRGGRVRLTDPSGGERELEAAAGRIEPEELGEAGRYRLLGDNGLDVPFAVNARCADLRTDESRPEPIAADLSGRPGAETPRREPKDFIWWLLAAVLLVAELFVYLGVRV